MVGEKTSIGSGIMMPNIPRELKVERLIVGENIYSGKGYLDGASFGSAKWIFYDNSANTSNNELSIEQDGSGDAIMGFKITGTDDFTMGMDNTDDNFHIQQGTSLSSTSGLIMDTTDAVGMGGAPLTSVKLAVVSTTKAFRPPAMTSAQQVAISTPTAGSIVYNSTSGSLMLYNGSAWQTITAS